MTPRRILNLSQAQLNDFGDGKSFAAKLARLGSILGSTGLGCSLVIVSPGKRAFPFHRHHVIEEMFFVLEGEGETRIGEETHPIRAGDLIAAPAGTEAHQIINSGQAELKYLAFSTLGSVDVLDYPDSGKMAVGAGIRNADLSTATYKAMGKITPTAYFDDEEPKA